MNRRSRIGRLVSGVALLGTFLAWLVLRADLMELIGQHNNVLIGLVLHAAALFLLTGGVSLLATGVSTSSAHRSSPAQPTSHEHKRVLPPSIGRHG